MQTKSLERSETLKRYIKGVLDTEMCLYVQENTLEDMRDICNRISTSVNVKKPKKYENNEFISDNMFLIAKIAAVVVAIIFAVTVFSEKGPIIAKIFLAAFAFAVGLVIGFGIGLVIGFVVGVIRKIINQKRINARFAVDMMQYEEDVEVDQLRVMLDRKRKEKMLEQIRQMELQVSKTRQNLKKIYSYGIIAPEYRNWAAVGTFYGYLTTGRTYSLTFDPNTGDQGAYNIFENERRLDLIITNTEEILDCMERVAKTQSELATQLRSANLQIGNMRRDFNNFASKSINRLDDIREIQSVISYNTNCIRQQTELMNWLTIMRY